MANDSNIALAQTANRKRRDQVFARRLRDLRSAAGMTLIDLSERSGLAASTLSKIEHGNMSPTYDTILSLAEGLDLDIAELVSGGPGHSVNGRKAVTRKGHGVIHATEQYDYEMLCTDIANRQFVPLLADIKAHSVEAFDGLLSHPGEEFVYVLSGRVELHTDFYAPTELEPGDCCYFDSTMGHALVNTSDEDAKVLWICSRVVGPLRTR